ncbi:MAG: glycyl-radical enzyme activating protein [Chloroflexota bacterium]
MAVSDRSRPSEISIEQITQRRQPTGQSTGLVFDIQRYCIHDGPGIRTVVFFKGCPLRCLWCCNPESQRQAVEIEFRRPLCRECGACLATCPAGAINADLSATTGPKIDREKCDLCGACVEACPTGALHAAGQWYSVEEALAMVMRDAPYYRRSGGGVTLSGGEPLMQPEFAEGLLRACYEQNVHTTVETSGLAAWSVFERIIPYTDLVLFDLKQMDEEAHIRLTGVPNRPILQNARNLAERGVALIFRVPLIPDENTQTDNLLATADFAGSLGVGEIHLMPFHQLGKDKYRRLDREYTLADRQGMQDSEEGVDEIRRARDRLAARGFTVWIGG